MRKILLTCERCNSAFLKMVFWGIIDIMVGINVAKQGRWKLTLGFWTGNDTETARG
jgi:hypothetical protein